MKVRLVYFSCLHILMKAFCGRKLSDTCPHTDFRQGHDSTGPPEPWGPRFCLLNRCQRARLASQGQSPQLPPSQGEGHSEWEVCSAGSHVSSFHGPAHQVEGSTWVLSASWAAIYCLTFTLDLCFPNFTTKLQEKNY